MSVNAFVISIDMCLLLSFEEYVILLSLCYTYMEEDSRFSVAMAET